MVRKIRVVCLLSSKTVLVFLRFHSKEYDIHAGQENCKVLALISCSLSKDNDRSKSLESLQFDLRMIKEATDDFSDANKLGQGGFGSVYKVAKKKERKNKSLSFKNR